MKFSLMVVATLFLERKDLLRSSILPVRTGRYFMKSIQLIIQHFQVPNCTRHDFLMTFAFPDGDFSPHFSLDSVLAVSFLLPIRLYRGFWRWMLKTKGMERKVPSKF